MTPDEIKNIPASIRGRLQNKARETGRVFSEILQYYAMECFLNRLSMSKYIDRFFLKGALMLVAWQAPQNRPTIDIDFLARIDNDLTNIESVIREICSIEVESDGLRFDTESIRSERIAEDVQYEGIRVSFIAYLEKSRINMQVDIAFHDKIYPKPIDIEYPRILKQKGSLNLKGYTMESVISEKYEAMVKLGVINSRMKDFYDIWLLSKMYDFQGGILKEALMATFTNRGTTIPQSDYPLSGALRNDMDKQKMWTAFIKVGRIQDAPERFGDVVDSIKRFLFPVLQSIISKKDFNKRWSYSKNWK
ncbi:MAG: nucleotidyl transferase AbiEii/AbiGii toxin family protein [candidate division Zixibacteria bacterium]